MRLTASPMADAGWSCGWCSGEAFEAGCPHLHRPIYEGAARAGAESPALRLPPRQADPMAYAYRRPAVRIVPRRRWVFAFSRGGMDWYRPQPLGPDEAA